MEHGKPSDEHHRLNKKKHRDLLRERHECVKSILVKDLHSKTVARGYILKWKPQMLHLVLDQSSKMGAVFDLTEVQRLGGREFILVGQLQSDVWTDPAAKNILKMSRNNQVIVDQVGGGQRLV